MRSPLPILVILAATTALGGCEAMQRTGNLFGFIKPYRIDLVQGNVVTKEQAAQLKIGMTRLQVRDVLGTPILADPFHADRWDYIFTLRRQGAPLQRRSVVVTFEDDKLKTIQAPELPTEREFVASISRLKDPRAPKLELSESELAALPPPPKYVAPPPEPEGPVRDYPPLEKS
ncbi:MAG: outer membrane protein assembly factor BamE [Burkholderiales bacterium]|nr:outer membrane protein assembly factor BamE [Burkholderiales bacterium]MDE1926915.1 outer membrane protein assembly factor BamE [Burkholderiales bacterium]MDE2158067.1 outer membrane protein assembly factor BamE [Burkholderiales bacterium]MDE2504372.1 outer membrane protein assembly factor BamE [Burkholderiales bacterium]